MMAKEQKTAAELEAMIIAELNEPSWKVSISPDFGLRVDRYNSGLG